MNKNSLDKLRDPIWQFIGVVAAVVFGWLALPEATRWTVTMWIFFSCFLIAVTLYVYKSKEKILRWLSPRKVNVYHDKRDNKSIEVISNLDVVEIWLLRITNLLFWVLILPGTFVGLLLGWLAWESPGTEFYNNRFMGVLGALATYGCYWLIVSGLVEGLKWCIKKIMNSIRRDVFRLNHRRTSKMLQDLYEDTDQYSR